MRSNQSRLVRRLRGGAACCALAGTFVLTLGGVSIELSLGSAGHANNSHDAPAKLAPVASVAPIGSAMRAGDVVRIAAAALVDPATMIDVAPLAPGMIEGLTELPPLATGEATFDSGSVMEPADLLSEAAPEALPRVAFVAARVTETAEAAPAPASVPGTIERVSLEDPVAFQTAAAQATSASLMTAYAPDDGALIEGPFTALFTAPAGRVHGLSSNGLDHWWSDRPLPATMTTKKELKCLAEAIYFEARSEPESGQAAVAQVIVNRVKNPAFPDTPCDVVYQNEEKRNACQFSFACDGKDKAIAEDQAWEKAIALATEYAEGKMWIAEIGASTHYHADYVNAGWAGAMKPVATVGRHIFYIAPNGGWS